MMAFHFNGLQKRVSVAFVARPYGAGRIGPKRQDRHDRICSSQEQSSVSWDPKRCDSASCVHLVDRSLVAFRRKMPRRVLRRFRSERNDTLDSIFTVWRLFRLRGLQQQNFEMPAYTVFWSEHAPWKWIRSGKELLTGRSISDDEACQCNIVLFSYHRLQLTCKTTARIEV